MNHTVPATRFRRELNKWLRRTKAGDRIIVTLNGRPIVIVEAYKGGQHALQDHLAEIRKFRGRLPSDYRVDRTTDYPPTELGE